MCRARSRQIFLAGGENARIEELNLLVLPDQVTASSALITGEIDYQRYVPFDMIGRRRRHAA